MGMGMLYIAFSMCIYGSIPRFFETFIMEGVRYSQRLVVSNKMILSWLSLSLLMCLCPNPFSVNLTQGTSIDKMSLSDWPMGNLWGIVFLPAHHEGCHCWGGSLELFPLQLLLAMVFITEHRQVDYIG